MKPTCIFELIVVKGVRQRHEQAGAADGHQLGDGRSPGAGDDEMGGGDAFRQVAEEGCQMRGDARLLVGLAQFGEILIADLLDNGETPAERRGHEEQRLRHYLGEEVRALTAAEHEEKEPTRRLGGNIGHVTIGQHGIAHRRTDHLRASLGAAVKPLGRRER